MTLKTGVMMLNIKIYSNRKQLFLVKIFHNITAFAVLWIK